MIPLRQQLHQLCQTPGPVDAALQGAARCRFRQERPLPLSDIRADLCHQGCLEGTGNAGHRPRGLPVPAGVERNAEACTDPVAGGMQVIDLHRQPGLLVRRCTVKAHIGRQHALQPANATKHSQRSQRQCSDPGSGIQQVRRIARIGNHFTAKGGSQPQPGQHDGLANPDTERLHGLDGLGSALDTQVLDIDHRAIRTAQVGHDTGGQARRFRFGGRHGEVDGRA